MTRCAGKVDPRPRPVQRGEALHAHPRVQSVVASVQVEQPLLRLEVAGVGGDEEGRHLVDVGHLVVLGAGPAAHPPVVPEQHLVAEPVMILLTT